jgi:predicted phosphodiesterase
MRAELLAIPDLHFPWCHDKALRWCIAQVKKYRPRYIVQLGDLYDQYCFSRYPKNPNVMTPQQELRRGAMKARKFWMDVTQASPESKRYQLLGNHDVRVNKRIAEKIPELQGLVKLSIYDFPGVQSVHSDREHIELKLNRAPVILLHGWMTRPAAHLAHFRKSCIFGHTHRASLIHQIQDGGQPPLFELNCGYLGDPTSPVFDYGGSVAHNWNLGFGLVDENGRPEFVGYPG